MLEITSPLYKKRLAKELNASKSGAYLKGKRIMSARIKAHSKVLGASAGCDLVVKFTTGLLPFHTVTIEELEQFVDGYGKSICANR